MKLNCSCEGFNENCFKCFGRGYYDYQELHPNYSYQIKKAESKKANSFPSVGKKILKKAHNSVSLSPFVQCEMIECPHCNAKIVTQKLKTHINRCHSTNGENSGTEIQVKKIKQTEHSLMKCPKCQVSVRSDRIDRHVKMVHNNNYLKQDIIKCAQKEIPIKSNKLRSHAKKVLSIISDNSKRKLIKTETKITCPVNKNKITILRKIVSTSGESKNNRLSATISEIRTIKSSNKKRDRVNDKIDLTRGRENSKKLDIVIAEKKINSDGSKDWYAFRERGKYGSHPSFDSMDDESLP